MKNLLLMVLVAIIINSCASKKDIFYMQDAADVAEQTVTYVSSKIQPNDILKITVESTFPEAALPYNRVSSQGQIVNNIQILQLDGYLVSTESTISFPVLGTITTANKTTEELEGHIEELLVSGGHLNQPTVNVRLLNAKVTILGEVNKPGTYNFTEQNITVLQALGYAGDLTINGRRDDVLLTREVGGNRRVTHLDLTSAEFMNGEFYFIKPNDVIVVNQNKPKVTSSGYISDFGVILTIASLALSVAVLLSR
ncbi:polysaccharide biosynthesis/export family protein [Winogradskyella alexanderae]|uniref:Polysaccharide biosynthesis/export family protein n=1 Tax=Winogradskyella alexanderae TaxID=2877123 RepID=A0ABS7XR09_9FLAO|nr:polysaccharide biosynthesis/export family protein [Winogradskyella alexanderae]MCA0132436.1 polysaccharide biosynthesis/export family protein [Winogradskyella alexanderae]